MRCLCACNFMAAHWRSLQGYGTKLTAFLSPFVGWFENTCSEHSDRLHFRSVRGRGVDCGAVRSSELLPVTGSFVGC